MTPLKRSNAKKIPEKTIRNLDSKGPKLEKKKVVPAKKGSK